MNDTGIRLTSCTASGSHFASPIDMVEGARLIPEDFPIYLFSVNFGEVIQFD